MTLSKNKHEPRWNTLHTLCGQDAHKNTPTPVHEATNYLLKGRVWARIGAEQFISRLSSSPQHPVYPPSPPAPPHTPPAIKRRLSPIRQKHWSRLSIRAMTSAGVRPAWWGPVFPPLQKFSVKSCISPLKHLMISLKDRPLTTRQFPHSSLLYADWLGTAFSRHASMNRNTSKVLTYTQQKGTHLQGMLQKCFLDWDEMHIWQQMEG